MTPKYEVYIERSAERDIKKLPADTLQRIATAIRALAINPRSHGSLKLKGSKSDWRIRVGSYRILYEIDDQRHRVSVMAIKPRNIAYRAILYCLLFSHLCIAF